MSVPPPTVEQVLAAHPWPAAHAQRARLEWLWHFELPVPVAQLWSLVSDTSRLNRALGLAEMKFEERDGLRWGTSRTGGVQHEWVEVPWNWVAGQWMESVRLYDRGFGEVLYGIFLFQPLTPETTRLSIYFGVVPRGLVGRLALGYGFPALQKDFQRVLTEAATQLSGLRPVFALPPPAPLSEQAEAKLRAAREKLVGARLDVPCVDALLGWIRTGDEADLFRIQVRERARAWGLDEQQLLRVALHATREAVLEISWDVVCPHCRGVTEAAQSLAGVESKGECPVCEVDFGTDTAESVEITFHVHSSIREVAHRTFCSAEPAAKEHIRLQRDLAPGQTLALAPKLEPGAYRVRVHGRMEVAPLDVRAGQGERAALKASALGPQAAAPEATLELHNDTAEPQRFVLEDARWSDHALRPGQLFSLQEYRDLFSEDYLGADVQLAIGDQTILFTDIVGSTAMYAERGDPAAFMEVRKHFADVFPEVAKHRGAVVKTIGDAVMAAFSDPLDAVRAAGAIHARFPPGRADSSTRLRISLNSGPCIAVKLNTGVDYFGQTVNLAAKLQALAESWQVAMSEGVARAPGVAEFLKTQGATLEPLTYSSKALRAPVAVQRWTCFTS